MVTVSGVVHAEASNRIFLHVKLRMKFAIIMVKLKFAYCINITGKRKFVFWKTMIMFFLLTKWIGCVILMLGKLASLCFVFFGAIGGLQLDSRKNHEEIKAAKACFESEKQHCLASALSLPSETM